MKHQWQIHYWLQNIQAYMSTGTHLIYRFHPSINPHTHTHCILM